MGKAVDMASWPRAAQFQFFRTFDRPHYAITARVDVSRLMARKSEGLPVFATCLWAMGAGLHAVPELRMRFVGEAVTLYDQVSLSPPIAREDGSFVFGYFRWHPDLETFNEAALAEIARARSTDDLNPDNPDTPEVAYASCLPWLDYTGLDNALPSRDDCIPRVSWGKIVPKGRGFDMAVSLQVHHALVDGQQVGQFFAVAQDALQSI